MQESSQETSQESSQEAVEAAEPLLLNEDIKAWVPDSLQPLFDVLADYPFLLVVILAAAGYLAGKILQLILTRGVTRLTSRTSSDFDDRLIEIARRPVLMTTVVLALLLATALLALPETLNNLTQRVLGTLLLLSWARASIKTVHMVLELVARNHERFEIVQERTIPLFEMTLKILLVGAAAYVLLMIWGVNPTAWLASAGVIGIAVGFAAKDTLANLFSGIFIVADAPYKIGDYIVLDSGERGKVTHLGMRSTRLLTRDDVEVTIPNAVIANAKIINETGGPSEKERIRIPVGVAYGTDLDQVCDVLVNVAAAHEEIVRNPSPRVRMRAFGASSVDFELLAWIDHPELRGRIRHELFMAVYKAFNEAGIGIPFPQQEVYVRSMPQGQGLGTRDQGPGTRDK
ncbi:MAG: mechanosensitive ion channel family protein [Xanthomonadales bacterium]|nr:mechanosensitive ion channel family protein [Xanthomonadales bacterium]NNL96470.1 mechanosensitive ion channel family protein [Xanthomonadales bacterium]